MVLRREQFHEVVTRTDHANIIRRYNSEPCYPIDSFKLHYCPAVGATLITLLHDTGYVNG